MMFRKTACALTLMFSGLSIAQPAAATTTILITYTGTVSDGFDVSGLFGESNTSLKGDTFKSVYTLTFPTSGAVDSNVQGLHQIYGGAAYGQSNTSPLLGQLTINGHTVFVGQDVGLHALYSPVYDPSGNFSEISDAVNTNSNTFLINYVLSNSGDNFISSLNFADELSHTVILSDVSEGSFTTPNDSGQDTYANFKNLTVLVQAVSAVPEPATWGMMIFGFGIAGVTLRVRRRETALA